MSKAVWLGLMIVLATVSFSYALTVKGVNLPDAVMAGDENLVLNGAGIRTKRLAGIVKKDIYVAGLYLKDKSSDAQQIIDADETMLLRIEIVSSLITSERFTEATRTGFDESTKGHTAPIQKEIDRFMSTFSEKIQDGDLFEIVYKKGAGVQTFKNGGKNPIVTIPGMPIKTALFGIWLGERSEEDLQKLARGLLGSAAPGK
ncbi:MAG: chalcone isomerase family protein [Desulfobacterales bacterium]|nr:chalcone isomerase family protein [Desulfobacterales bacterium]